MRELILNVSFIVYGEDLDIIEGGHIVIENGVITEVGKGYLGGCNAVNLHNDVAFPKLINSHIHLADCCFPDYGANLSIDNLVGEPHGLKYKFLSNLSDEEFASKVLSILHYLLKSGVYAVFDFREGGIRGAKLAYKVKEKIKDLNYVILGMPESKQEEGIVNEVKSMGKYVDGIAISTPIYYEPNVLAKLSNIAKNLGLKIATHISETKEVHELNDLEISLRYLKPDIIVHGTHLNVRELEIIKERDVKLILCPRANAWFRVGIPPVEQVYKLGIDIAIGTDNCGWVKPDLWREADFLINILRLKINFTDWKWITKALTINPAKFFGMKPPIIMEGYEANFIILDGNAMGINSSGDKLLSIIKRGGPELVKLIISKGVIMSVR